MTQCIGKELWKTRLYGWYFFRHPLSAPAGLVTPHCLVSPRVTKTTENFNKKFPNDLKNYQNDTQWISGLKIFYHSKYISQPLNTIVARPTSQPCTKEGIHTTSKTAPGYLLATMVQPLQWPCTEKLHGWGWCLPSPKVKWQKLHHRRYRVTPTQPWPCKNKRSLICNAVFLTSVVLDSLNRCVAPREGGGSAEAAHSTGNCYPSFTICGPRLRDRRRCC